MTTDKKAHTDALDLNSLSADSLNASLLDSKGMLMKLRFQKSIGNLNDFSQFKKLRKKVARIKTAINLKKG